MTTDYEVTHLKSRHNRFVKKMRKEFERLEKYIESCKEGDRPISPQADKLERFLYLKRKLMEERK